VPDVVHHDARMYQRQRVNVSTAGVQAEGGAGGHGSPAASADGRFLAFGTNAPNLVSGDTNNAYDVFVRDRVANVTTRVSVASDGTQGNASSLTPRISRDGRYVAFTSSASNLVAGDTNGERDVFVHDRQSGETTRVSVADNGAQAAGDSRDASISDNGRLVAFSSSASNLVENDTNGATDVFVRDRATGRTTRVSVATGGTQGLGGHSWEPFVSGDGRFVAFTSAATNLVAGDDNAYDDIFVHDRLAGTTERVNVRTGGVQANPGHSGWSAMSRDGRYVVFNSLAPNLVVGDSNNLMDVFVHDRLTSQTSRVSVTTGGFQAGGNSLRPTISGDGRLVAFDSDAPNLVPDDTNAQSDVFVHDRVTGKTVRASLAPGERQGNSFSYSATFSGDGRSLVFLSAATDLTFGDTNNATDVFVRAATPVIDVVSPRSGSTSGETTLRITGAGFAPGTLVLVGGLLAVNVDGTNPERLWATTPPNVAGQHDIVVTVPGYEPQRLPVAYTYVALSGSAIDDADGDGLSDQYEAQFSLDLLDPGDATADLDADGPSTAAEQADGSHPNGAVKRYMAEGATSAFFKTEFALTNPGDGDATVQLRFLPTSGTPLHHLLRVPAHSRKTVDAKDVAGLQNAEFSTVMESDRTVVLDRTMHWDASGYGSHSETAISALSMTWYLAEGATHSGFDLFYLLQNPASTPTGVQVTYFLPAPQTPVVKNYTLPPSSRFNIWVDLESPFLASTDVSAQILASQPIAVERAMYLSGGGQLFAAGHQSAGVTAPMTSWFLAEGATGHFFDMFVLLANPSATAADVRVTFLKPDGSTLVRTYSVASQSRFNIWVDYEHPSLADTAVSTTVEVTNGVPIVVERSMWWPGDAGTWREAHNSPGATSTGTAWVVSGAEDGGANNAETYVLMANTASFAATVRVTALFDDGKTAVREFEVPAHSRTNVALRSEFPGAVGRRVGVLVESIGLGEAPLVVESAVYSDAGGVTWAAGSNALATRLR
ncbi:MAG: IPT/TIG domain-containing protein, partial [Vicinamibacterales bacterium]